VAGGMLFMRHGVDVTVLACDGDSVTGGELLQRFVNEDNLTESEAAYYLRQLLLAVEYMHSRNVVHLDLKVSELGCTMYLRTHNTACFKQTRKPPGRTGCYLFTVFNSGLLSVQRVLPSPTPLPSPTTLWF